MRRLLNKISDATALAILAYIGVAMWALTPA